MKETEGAKIQKKLDGIRLLKNISVAFLIESVIILGVVLYFTFGALRHWGCPDVFALSLIPVLFLFIVSIASYFLAALEYKSLREEEEKFLLEKRKGSRALESGEEVLLVSKRSLENFKKYSPYVLSAIQFSVGALFLAYIYNYWQNRIEIPAAERREQFAFVSGLLAVICLFSGVFAIGQSREKLFRWMRVSGGCFLMAFAIFAVSAIAIFLGKSGHPEWYLYIRNLFFILLSIICFELFLNFIMEFYRPRAGKEERPVFESRVLSLFTEPGGIMKNISETLDYQFGFSISGTWLYRIFENSIVPLLLLWMISLWLMTSITEILPDELGLRESFGVVEQNNLLEAGIHFNLPWPYGKILRVPARDIQEVFIGTGEKEGKEKYEPIILWAISHYEKEENFLVAAEKAVSPEELPVSYVSAIFNVQYKIKKTEIFDYAYRNQDIKKTIKMVGECVAVKYLAGKDILKILAVERKSGEEELKMKMQEAYDNAGLGIEILFLNILDVHPPVEKVAPVFQNVVGALEEKETEILVAKAYEKKIIPFAEAEKAKTILDAETESKNIVKLAEAENERFGKQLTAYRQMPSMFKLRTYLDFFENDCAQIKKIIIASEIPYNVFILNLEEKQRLDLLDIPIENITPEKNSN